MVNFKPKNDQKRKVDFYVHLKFSTERTLRSLRAVNRSQNLLGTHYFTNVGNKKRPFWTPIASKRDMMWYEILRP